MPGINAGRTLYQGVATDVRSHAGDKHGHVVVDTYVAARLPPTIPGVAAAP
jgi:hypothetical protein